MVGQSSFSQRSLSGRFNAEQLCYPTMSIDNKGKMISKEGKEKLRSKNGYCLTCDGYEPPVLLYKIIKSMNPLFANTKEPITKEGESLDGQCLRCNPEKDPRRKCFAQRNSVVASNRNMEPSSSHHRAREPSSSSNYRVNPTTGFGNRDIQRDLSNGSMAMSLSRRNLTREQSNASFAAAQSRLQGGKSIPSFSSGSSFSRRDLQGRDPSNSSLSSHGRSDLMRDLSSGSFASISESHGENSSASSSSLASATGTPKRTLSSDQQPGKGKALPALQPAPKPRASDDLAVMPTLRESKSLELVDDEMPPLMPTLRESKSLQSVPETNPSDADADTVASQLDASKTPEEIVAALKNYPSSKEVLQKASSAISAMSESTARAQLIRGGAVASLVHGLKEFHDDAAALESAMSALRSLSIDPLARQEFQLAFASKVVTETMMGQATSPKLLRDSCALLSNVSVNPESQEVSAVSCDVLKAIVHAIDANRDNSAVVSTACFALSNMTHETSNLKALGGIDDIFGVLEHAGNCRIKNFQDPFDIMERMQILKAENASLDSLVEMGFSEDAVQEALKKCDGNTERALEVLCGGL